MTDYKIVLGLLAVAAGFGGYVPYFADIFKGLTKPHIFSWLVWSVLETIGFFAQVVKGAGPGSWVTGVTAVLCLGVFFSAIKRGEKTSPVWTGYASRARFAALWFGR